MILYSQKTNMPLYACADGGGVIIEDNRLSFVGKTFQFYKGKKLLLSNYKRT